MNNNLMSLGSIGFWERSFESIGNGVIITDTDKIVAFANSAATSILEYTSEEMVNHSFYDVFNLINYNKNQQVEDVLDKVIKTGKRSGLTNGTMIVTKSGIKKYVSADISPIITNEKELIGSILVFKDITRIKKMEINLKNEESNFENIFNTSPVGFILVNKNGEVVKINNTACSFVGKTIEKCIGRRLGDIFFCEEVYKNDSICGHGASCNECPVKRAVEEALLTDKSSTNIEFFRRIILPNKKAKNAWFRASVTSMINGDEKIASLVFNDITERKEKEIQCKRERDFYHNIFENFPAMVWRVGADSKNIYMNKSCSEFFGNRSFHHLNKENNFIHPDDLKNYHAMTPEDYQNKKRYEITCRAKNPQDEYRWISLIITSITDTNGDFDGFLGFGVDITEKKRAEEGIERYKKIMELIHDIIMITDEDGYIIDANEAAVSTYGYTRDEFKKLTSYELSGAKELDLEIRKKAFSDGISFTTKHRIKNGSWITVEVSSKGTMVDTKPVLINIVRDVTEREITISQLKMAKEAAETANKAKSAFLANMSHEIRTPLNAIVGMIDLTFLTDLTPEQNENLTIVKNSVDTLLNTINDILDVSKMEAGKLVFENITFDIQDLIVKLLKIHTPKATEKNILLSYAFATNVPQYICGDPNRISQIFNNLIGNAIKFSDSGEIVVSSKTLCVKDNVAEIEFSIKDQGIGMSEETQKVIFGSFIQADTSFTRRFGGTGLGLTISKELVEKMNGHIWVESKLGEGSNFHFTLKLPLATKCQTDIPKKTDDSEYEVTSPEDIQILVAENDKINQVVIKKILDKKNFRVDIVDDGKMAVEKHRNGNYDIILMDIQMPVMDGIEATKNIRRIDKKIPIIALTAYALKGDRERFLSHGMDEYLSKPIDADKLYSAIKKCTRTKKYNDLSNVKACIDKNGNASLKFM